MSTKLKDSVCSERDQQLNPPQPFGHSHILFGFRLLLNESEGMTPRFADVVVSLQALRLGSPPVP